MVLQTEVIDYGPSESFRVFKFIVGNVKIIRYENCVERSFLICFQLIQV